MRKFKEGLYDKTVRMDMSIDCTVENHPTLDKFASRHGERCKLRVSVAFIVIKRFPKFQSSRSSVSGSVEHLCVLGSCAVQCIAA